MLGKLQRAAVVDQRFAHHPSPLVDLGERTDGGQITWRCIEHEGELNERIVELIELDQCAAESDASDEVVWVVSQARAADSDGVLVLPGAPVFFRELRKNKRRRILLDPASKFD